MTFKQRPCGLFLWLLIFFFGGLTSSFAQQDSLWTTNENVLVGELKGLKNGVATLKTAYSDSDFKIDWQKLKTLRTSSQFLISLKNGKRFDGRLIPADSGYVEILKNKDTLIGASLHEVVFLREIKASFLSKFKASLSVGYNFTKAERLSEFSIRSHLEYKAKHWGITGKFNDIVSTRENTETIKRLSASLGYQYYLNHNWFTVTQVSWLSNTEQNIRLRTLGQLGIGKYLIRNNKLYWGTELGVSYNNENFDTENGDERSKNSAEAFLGTELNLYNLKDFSLLTRAVVYPSMTESGRWRFDYNIDLKYDLPLDFFVKLGFIFNYDNKPVSSASETDYIFQTTLGWDYN